MASQSGGRRGGGGQRGGGGNNGTRSNNSNNGSARSSRGGGGGRNRGNANNSGNRRSRQLRYSNGGGEDNPSSSGSNAMRDEEILIAFMPYLKGDNTEATKIHEQYQSSNDQKAFLTSARQFLQQQSSGSSHSQNISPPNPQQQQHSAPVGSSATTAPFSPMAIAPRSTAQVAQPPTIERAHNVQQTALLNDRGPSTAGQPLPVGNSVTSGPVTGMNLFPPPSGASGRGMEQNQVHGGLGNMRSMENGLDELLQDDPIVTINNIWNGAGNNSSGAGSPITPPRPYGPLTAPVQQAQQQPSSPWNSSVLGPQHSSPPPGINMSGPQISPVPQSHQQPYVLSRPVQQPPLPQAVNPPNAVQPSMRTHGSPLLSSTTPTATATPGSPALSNGDSRLTTPGTATKTPSKKEAPPPKRVWTHFEEQPGRIRVGDIDGSDPSLIMDMAPRSELSALWSLPLDYLRQKWKDSRPLEQALAGLTVGLFRRGCTENGGQASIISKKVLGDDNRSYQYGVDRARNLVGGRVPFYSPRTPGHVLFRLYWDREPLYTLATGPTLHVRVLEGDFDSSVRFILSNFKGRKTNPTSLSSLNSLAQVLETPLNRPNDSAARAVWGCIQEARKVLDACANEYVRTTNKLLQLEDTVEGLKKQVEEEDAKSQLLSDDEPDEEENSESEAAIALREKTKALMSGRASCERKWRDSQLAFASILRAAVTNPSMNTLLRRDMISKMRIEFELWCPLSEEFASPGDDSRLWFEAVRDLNQSITAEDFQTYAQARTKMQMRTLGFEPNTISLDDILFPRSRTAPGQRSMNAAVVSVFNNVSAAMGQYYQELYADEERVVRLRELVRQRTEQCVRECGAFPPGTAVVIFGSSANGFGSPKSDIDMCLQLPQGARLNDHDAPGAEAMAKLASRFDESGMKEVDTARLTARIPIIKYHCPDPENEENLIECDLSMHNPLAVLNTGLLRSYAEITPVTRVLATIIKRWAKARDINNPARHTLSSYGYIIMLLHFLTYHRRAGNGLLAPVAPPEGNPRYRTQPGQPDAPLLPNLQWMDHKWPSLPRGTPYRDLPALPKVMIPHPMEEGKRVNSYYFQSKGILQELFPGQDLSLAILLASFFRYYAYEFDYKRFVVSLHSTASRGLVEREVKAEVDGWRNYSAALTIEDPFETFYDVAHVLRGGYYHRIRREFAVAYTKIADAASGRQTGSWKEKGDLSSLSGKDLIDWICEPLTTERES